MSATAKSVSHRLTNGENSANYQKSIEELLYNNERFFRGKGKGKIYYSVVGEKKYRIRVNKNSIAVEVASWKQDKPTEYRKPTTTEEKEVKSLMVK